MKDNSAARSRTPLILLGVTVLLVALALVLVFTRGTGTPPDPRSPEGVVQAYVTAVLSGDRQQAAGMLGAPALAGCRASGMTDTPDMRVALLGSTIQASRATVEVLITQNPGSRPFGLGNNGYNDSFQLAKQGERWVIELAPWTLLACPDAAVPAP